MKIDTLLLLLFLSVLSIKVIAASNGPYCPGPCCSVASIDNSKYTKKILTIQNKSDLKRKAYHTKENWYF